jgi:hypothetical protein
MIWKARTLKIILVTTCLAVAIGASGGAQAQYVPKDPNDTGPPEFTIEERCVLWTEKHIGADHVPTQCELYAEPIPDTKEARDKAYHTQLDGFVQCTDKFMKAQNGGMIMGYNMSVSANPRGNIYAPPERAKANIVGVLIPKLSARVKYCQELNALTDPQVHEINGNFLKSLEHSTPAIYDIIDRSEPPDAAKLLLELWGRTVTVIFLGDSHE